MNLDPERGSSNSIEIDLTQVPNWHQESSSMLWELGDPVQDVHIALLSKKVWIPPEVSSLRERLRVGPNFFPGPFANCERVAFSDSGIDIEVAETDFFTYLTSSYYFRDHQGDNPVRPLGVTTVLLTPDNKLIFEKRSNVADFNNKMSVFGAAFTPADTFDPTLALRNIVQKKTGLEIDPLQIQAVGMGRDNINYVFCLYYLVRLHLGQAEEMLERFIQQRQSKEKTFFQVSADESLAYIERLLMHRDVTEWNPLGYDNLIYALASAKLRSEEQIATLLDRTKRVTDRRLEYTYPIEAYL